MKKFFTLLFTASTLTLHAQYQLPNSGFEEWDSVYYSTRKGAEPVGWNSFISGSGNLKSMAGHNQLEEMPETRPGSTGKKSAKLFARNVFLGIYAQGNLTTGCINMGSMTATDANGNYNYTEIGEGKQNQRFTGLPDAMRVWVKYHSSHTEYPYGKVCTILHTEGYYQDPMGNEDSITAKLVGAAIDTLITSQDEWQELVIPFTYEETEERPAYALVSFSSNTMPGKGKQGDYMMVDDLEYLYYSELDSLSYDGKAILEEGKTGYEIDAVYQEDKLAYAANGKGATVERSYDKETGLVTLTVKGDDWSENNSNQHEYKLQFKKDTGNESSISATEAGKGNRAFDIYDLNGVKVRGNATTTEGLPKGVYLSNGVKIVVK